MRIATTQSASLWHAVEKLTAFVELEAAIRPVSAELSCSKSRLNNSLRHVPKNIPGVQVPVYRNEQKGSGVTMIENQTIPERLASVRAARCAACLLEERAGD